MGREITIGIMGLVVLGAGLLTGCAVREKLKWADERAGEIFFNPASERASSTGDEAAQASTMINAKELKREQKEKIDRWLEKNNLNRYGDAIGTIYTGGTPLFNELTGEAKERFQYLLEKMPDVLERIEN